MKVGCYLEKYRNDGIHEVKILLRILRLTLDCDR